MTDPTGYGKRHSYSPLERGIASLLFRPQVWHSGASNYLGGITRSLSDVHEDEAARPAVLRVQPYQQQTEDEREYVSLPGRGEERGGTAKGGVFWCLPGQRVNVYDPPMSSENGLTCEAHSTFGPGVYRAYGLPDLESGDVQIDGWREGMDGTDLVTHRKSGGGWKEFLRLTPSGEFSLIGERVIVEAPLDGKVYGRSNGAWVEIVTP